MNDDFTPPNTNKSNTNNRILPILCWVFSAIVWILLIIYIITFVSSRLYTCLYPLIICYIIYFVLQLCSSTASFLCNKNSDQGMYQKMGNLYMTPPEIKFYCECYHYEYRYYTTRDRNGNVYTNTTTVRVVTYRDCFIVPYYSARDVSGLFYLNCEEVQLKKKTYVQLELLEEINFADTISYMDYMSYKEEFWRRNRFRDIYMDFNETRIIPGLTQHNLIKFGENDPCYVNYFWFLFFTIITFAEFYKLFFNSFCVYQSYKVRKLVSTRYDLNQPVYQEQYLPLVPQLNLIKKTYTYEPKEYNYINTRVSVDLPTKEELEKAEKYKDKIPDYKVSIGNDAFHEGVIVDNNENSCKDYNDPPPAFAAYAGNVAISQSQINKTGAPSRDFGNNSQRVNLGNSNKPITESQNQGLSSSNYQGAPAPGVLTVNTQSESRDLKSSR